MISINATLVIQIINFLVLVYILNKILFKPILKGLQQRDDAIEGSKTRAKALEEKGEEKLQEYNKVLAEARKKAMETQAEIRQEGNLTAMEITQVARSEELNIINAIRKEIAAEVEIAKKELQSQAEAISNSVTKLILGREV